MTQYIDGQRQRAACKRCNDLGVDPVLQSSAPRLIYYGGGPVAQFRQRNDADRHLFGWLA
jgi:hypothetical protein